MDYLSTPIDLHLLPQNQIASCRGAKPQLLPLGQPLVCLGLSLGPVSHRISQKVSTRIVAHHDLPAFFILVYIHTQHFAVM